MPVTSTNLTPVQAERVCAVFEETLQKLAFLGTIAPDVLAHKDELSQFVGDEISRIIREQGKLEKEYEQLVGLRSEYKGLANKSKYRENQLALQEVSRKLRDSTKNLCRNLKENPNVGGNLIKIQQERTDIEELFQKAFEEMETAATFQRLRKAVDADRQEEKDIANLIKREKQLAVDVKHLEEELEALKLDCVKDVKERKQQISALKKTLRTLQSTTKIRQQYAKSQSKAKMEARLRGYRAVEQGLEQDIDELDRERRLEVTVNGELVDFLSRKQRDLGDLMQAWQDKHDLDTDRKKAELEALAETRNAAKLKLDHLRERMAHERATKDAMEAERQRVAAMERLRHEEELARIKAAEVVQREWRSLVKRGALAKKAATGKKKKKKGGAKKKGGKKKK
jgi:hypothetical protein